MRLAFFVALIHTATVQATPRDSTAFNILIEAGSRDLREAVVPFRLPESAPAVTLLAADQDGNPFPVQQDGEGNGWIFIRRLNAGAHALLTVHVSDTPADSVVRAIKNAHHVRLEDSLGEVLRYVTGVDELPREDIDSVYARAGYLHPVYTPSGHLVTDDYPPNHVHHHGVWAAWTKTAFQGRTPDFWNVAQRTGGVEVAGLGQVWSGPVHAGIVASHRYVDYAAPGGRAVALTETWRVRVYPPITPSERTYRMFDLDVEQRAMDDTLFLPTYHYGGVGVRGHREWNGAEGAIFLTSEGLDRSEGHATRARWCHIGGYVDGALRGIAVLGHPANYQAPQPMRIHPDEPFFNFAPSQAGDWMIVPGESYSARYRFVIYDGEPNAADLDRLWTVFADPPRVVLVD